mgnify:CR=1 FL=1
MNYAEEWLLIRNVEYVECLLPDWERVLEGSHIIRALGNDGMGVDMTLSTDEAWESDASALVQLSWLGKYLNEQRRVEVMASMSEYSG